MKQFCFTLDDNIRFLEELVRGGHSLLTDSPYISLLHSLHNKYAVKFQLNMFYRYHEGGFSLSDVPNTYLEQFQSFSPWLKASFHSLQNDPPFPYENASPKQLTEDYNLVTNEILRIMSKAASTCTTTLHYVCATQPALIALRQCGVKALIGMFFDKDGPEALNYSLDSKASALMREKDILHDKATGIVYVRNHAIIDRFTQLELPVLMQSLQTKSFVQLMTHEQYFYSDYIHYQPDFADKIEYCIHQLVSNGYKSVFLEERLSII